MNPAVFWDMSLREWILTQRGFFELEELRLRGEWERTRWGSFWVLKSQTGKKWPHKVTDIIKFEWEKDEMEPEDYLLTEDEMQYLARKMGRFTDRDGNFFNA